MNNNELLLSIYVPFYNRYDNLEKIIKSVIKAKSRDFELLIVDHFSDKPVKDVIDFDDNRIRVVRQELSPLDIILCKGKYTIYVLDKDYIEGDRIDAFLDVLSKNEAVIAGYSVLNASEKNNSYKIVSNNSILQFGYLFQHPTGYFFLTDVLQKFIKDNFSINGKRNGVDFLMTECALVGSMMQYNTPLVKSGLTKIAKYSKSYTYSKAQKNIYFFPEQLLRRLQKCLEHLDSLTIIKINKCAVIFRLYYSTLFGVTWGIKQHAQNKDLAYHYSYEVWNVTVSEMLKNSKELHNVFSKVRLISISRCDRLLIECMAYVKILIKMFIVGSKKLAKSFIHDNIKQTECNY